MASRRRMWRRGWIAAAAIAGLACGAAGAGAARGQSLNLSAGISTWYDSNVLQYSDAQLAQFESGRFASRFSIDAKDDVTLNPSLALTWGLDQGKGRRHSLRLKADGDFHDKNSTADFHAASLTWRETFTGDRRFMLRGYYLPDYYLRQLKDVESGLYERAQFSLAIGEVALSQVLKPGTRLGLNYQVERRVYTPSFPERTSDAYQGELSLEFDRLPNHGALEFVGAFRKSLADGRDYPSSVALPYPDVSYTGWWAGFSGRTELSRAKATRIGGDLSYTFERREYDSERGALDRSHAGRSDSNHVFEAGLRAQFRPHWTVRGFDHYDTNHASYGQGVVLSSDPGSYSQNQVGLEISWSGDLWTRARPGAGRNDEGAN